MGGFGGMESQEGMTTDAAFWNEGDHPRNTTNGQFTEKGGASGSICGGYNSVSVEEIEPKGNRRRFNVNGDTFTQVLLPKAEYAMVMHAVDTDITPDKIERRKFWQPIENHVYGILIVDEDVKDYVITMKKPIL